MRRCLYILIALLWLVPQQTQGTCVVSPTTDSGHLPTTRRFVPSVRLRAKPSANWNPFLQGQTTAVFNDQPAEFPSRCWMVQSLVVSPASDLQRLLLHHCVRSASKSSPAHRECAHHSAPPLPLGQASLTLPQAAPTGLALLPACKEMAAKSVPGRCFLRCSNASPADAGEQKHCRFKLARWLIRFQIQHPLQILACPLCKSNVARSVHAAATRTFRSGSFSLRRVPQKHLYRPRQFQ